MVTIIDFGSKKSPYIKKCVVELGYQAELIDWTLADETICKKSQALILSGAPVLLSQMDYSGYVKNFSFLSKIEIPVLGICFGHQLLGLLNGSKVFMDNENRDSIQLTLLKNSLLFEGVDSLVFQADHTEGITLPPNFELFASSKDYEVEAMKHKTRIIFGVQFHPEVSGSNGVKLLSNFLSLIV